MYALLKTQYACIYTQRMLHLYVTEGLTSNSESAGQKYSNKADVMSPNANCKPCMTAYCLYYNTYDPGISPGSANQCILGGM